jgi:CysZ protein
MVLSALVRSLPQIMLPGVRSILWRSLALTLLVFSMLAGAIWFGSRALLTQTGWMDAYGVASAALAFVVGILAAWLLFRAVAVAIVGLYADRIVALVEAASYPDRLAFAKPTGTVVGIRVALRSATRAVGWNLAALPVYLLLLATGVGAPVLFLLLNAYLLGRDLAELVEGRHPQFRAFTPLQRWQIGFVSAVLFLPPVVNLLAPILSVAMATHMFHAPRQN